MASDPIPQDICPLHSNSVYMYLIGNQFKTSFEKVVISEGNWDQRNQDYGYTVSMQLYMTDNWCYLSDPHRAVEVCNIFNFGRVMTIYKTQSDRARVFFHADKAYYESLSGEFDLPSNQWVTIQIALSREGYEI